MIETFSSGQSGGSHVDRGIRGTNKLTGAAMVACTNDTTCRVRLSGIPVAAVAGP